MRRDDCLCRGLDLGMLGLAQRLNGDGGVDNSGMDGLSGVQTGPDATQVTGPDPASKLAAATMTIGANRTR